MDSFRLFDRRVGILAAAFALLISAVVPVFASAAQVTTRSIELSSSTKAATGVTYNIEFTSVGAGTMFFVDFCENSPLVGQTCDAPAGFSVSSASTSTAGWTFAAEDANTAQLTGTVGATSNIAVELANVANPTNDGPLYARIVTYAADNYVSATDLGTYVDDGSVALNITDGISVGGSVLETLTFCVSGANAGANPIGAGCTGTLVAPTLELGETSGAVKALSSSAVSTGDIYTQVSSNAIGGVVVRLKTNRACGGLARVDTPTVCEIAPALAADIAAGEAKFGVKAAADTTTDTALSATGTLQTVAGSNYNASTYALNWVSGNASGVASLYGDPILDTLNTTPDPDVQTQPSNKNMKLTFGASIAPNTPAGRYSAELSLIATGKF